MRPSPPPRWGGARVFGLNPPLPSWERGLGVRGSRAIGDRVVAVARGIPVVPAAQVGVVVVVTVIGHVPDTLRPVVVGPALVVVAAPERPGVRRIVGPRAGVA